VSGNQQNNQREVTDEMERKRTIVGWWAF